MCKAASYLLVLWGPKVKAMQQRAKYLDSFNIEITDLPHELECDKS